MVAWPYPRRVKDISVRAEIVYFLSLILKVGGGGGIVRLQSEKVKGQSVASPQKCHSIGEEKTLPAVDSKLYIL